MIVIFLLIFGINYLKYNTTFDKKTLQVIDKKFQSFNSKDANIVFLSPMECKMKTNH